MISVFQQFMASSEGNAAFYLDQHGKEFVFAPSDALRTPVLLRNTDNRQEIFHEIKRIAEDLGGKLIGAIFCSGEINADLEDECHKRFRLSYAELLAGSWSPHDNRKNRAFQSERLKKLAATRGWRVLTPYKGEAQKIQLEDSEGNRWWAPPKLLKDGALSPFEKQKAFREKCEKKLLMVQEIAKAKGGRVISERFAGRDSKVELEDSKGRRWLATPSNIISGSWSPFEARESSGERRKAIIPSKLPPEKIFRYYASTDDLVFIHGSTRDALNHSGFKNGEAKRAELREALAKGRLRPGYSYKPNYLPRVAFMHACMACSLDAEKLMAIEAARRAEVKAKKQS